MQPTIPICDRTPKACSFIHASLIIVRGGYCHRSLVDRWLVGHVRELWLNGDSYYWILNRKPYQGGIEWFQPPSVISNLGSRPHFWNLAHFTVLLRPLVPLRMRNVSWIQISCSPADMWDFCRDHGTSIIIPAIYAPTAGNAHCLWCQLRCY